MEHVGGVRLAGTLELRLRAAEDHPRVEGWHEGAEWIDSGTLLERVNFVGKELGNVKNPGVRGIIDRRIKSSIAVAK